MRFINFVALADSGLGVQGRRQDEAGGSIGEVAFPCETCEVRVRTICAALNAAELRELNAIAISVNLKPGETIFYQGDE